MIIVCLSALVVFSILGYVRQQAKDDRIQAEKQDIVSSMNSLSLQINTITNQCLSLSTQKGFDRLRLVKGSLVNSDYIYLSYAKDSLISFCGANGLIEDIVVTFFNCPAIITSHYAFDNYGDFQQFYSSVDLDDAFASVPTGVCTTLSTLFFSETTLSLPSMVRGVPVIPMTVPLTSEGIPMNNVGSVIVLLRSNELKSMLFSTSLMNEGARFTLTSNEAILWESSETNNTDLSFIRMECNGTYLKAIVSLPPNAIYSYTQPVLRILMGYSLLGLGIGMIVALLSAIIATKPIHDILATIGGNNRYGRDKTAHQVILQTLDDMMKDNTHLSQVHQITEQEQLSQKLERLLFGFWNEDDLSDPIPSQGVLCYCRTQNMDNLTLSTIPSLLSNYFHRKMPKGYLYHQLSHESFLLIAPCSNEAERTQLSNIIRSMFEECAAFFSVDIFGVMGNIYTIPDEISASFEAIKLTFHSYRGQYNEAQLIITNQQAQGNSLNLSTLTELYHLLVAGKTEQVHQILEHSFLDSRDSQNGMEQVFYAIRMVLIMAMEQVNIDSHIPHYYPNKTPDDNITVLIDASETICEYVGNSKRSHNQTLLQTILDTIEEEYTDSEFYNTVLAEKVGISEKYLYSFVKEQTGRTVTDLIQSKRVEMAYSQLTRSDKAVNDIWQNCGFATYNTFYKTIKRIYGMSPLELRANQKTIK